MPAIPPSSTPVVDGTWDAQSQVDRIKDDAGEATLRKMYAFVEAGADPNLKGSYSFPHHVVGADGQPGAANVNGVRNALSRLGGQSRVPAADRPAVRSHLQRHMDDYHKAHPAAARVPIYGERGEAGWRLPVQK